MQSEQIKKWIKEAHDNAVERGFYECTECKGDGGFTRWNQSVFPPEPEESIGCDHCKCTGIDQNKNIGELLMLIVCEISEAVEANRCGRFCKWEYDFDFAKYLTRIVDTETMQLEFEDMNKDTFEDEIADVFIRLFDLCGYKNIELSSNFEQFDFIENVPATLFEISRYLECVHDLDHSIDSVFQLMISFCNNHNIPIEKHIEAKMAYNRTRPYKHGKNY